MPQDPSIDYLLLLVGAVFVGGGLWEGYFAFAALCWERTRGRIIERNIKRDWRSLAFSDIEILYSFEVNGYNYVSTNIKPGLAGNASTLSVPFLPKGKYAGEEFAPGSEVYVIYDPLHPRRCALENGGFAIAAVGVLIGAAIICVAVFTFGVFAMFAMGGQGATTLMRNMIIYSTN